MNLRTNQNYKDRIAEEDIAEIIGLIIMKEAEVGLEKDSFQIVPYRMTKVVVVDLDQV